MSARWSIPISPSPGPVVPFALPNLPAGTYTIAAWHERLGTREQQVTVAAGESKDVEFTFAR